MLPYGLIRSESSVGSKISESARYYQKGTCLESLQKESQDVIPKHKGETESRVNTQLGPEAVNEITTVRKRSKYIWHKGQILLFAIKADYFYERVALLALKNNTKKTAGQSSQEKHYVNTFAKQCSPWDWFVTQEINELILCFKTDTGNKGKVIIANTYQDN